MLTPMRLTDRAVIVGPLRFGKAESPEVMSSHYRLGTRFKDGDVDGLRHKPPAVAPEWAGRELHSILIRPTDGSVSGVKVAIDRPDRFDNNVVGKSGAHSMANGHGIDRLVDIEVRDHQLSVDTGIGTPRPRDIDPSRLTKNSTQPQFQHTLHGALSGLTLPPGKCGAVIGAIDSVAGH